MLPSEVSNEILGREIALHRSQSPALKALLFQFDNQSTSVSGRRVFRSVRLCPTPSYRAGLGCGGLGSFPIGGSELYFVTAY